MRKFLLIASAVCFLIALVVYWFGSICVGAVMTLILGALIALDVYLLRNNARWWIAILMFVIAFSVMTSSFSSLFMRDGNEVLTSNEEITITDEETETSDEDITTEEDKSVISDAEEADQEETVQTKDDAKETVEKQEKKSKEPTVVTKVVEKKVPVEKVVEKEVIKEVPVEKTVEKEVIVEVPAQKQEEATSTPTPEPTPIPTPTPQNIYYNGDPTVMNGGYGYGYSGDPTVMNNGYNGYYGDPTGGYNNYNSNNVRISGKNEVLVGETYTYTIVGINSFSKSKLKLPEGVSYEGSSGNKVKLYFEQVGAYSIGYGNASIKVEAYYD